MINRERKMITEKNVDPIRHFSHEHVLMPIPWPEDRSIHCSFCNFIHFIFEKTGYACFDCSYFINKSCVDKYEPIFNHQLHTRHPLSFGKRPLISNNTTCCYFCDCPLEDDEIFTYGCDKCSDFYMHVFCAKIEQDCIIIRPFEVEDLVSRFSCHGYPLITLVEGHDVQRMLRHNCFACQSPWSGPAYSCKLSQGYCKNFLHKSCAEMPESIKHPFHSRHSLQLRNCIVCDLCDKTELRLAYCCDKGGCKISLGVECLSLTAVKCLSHDHALCLTDEESLDGHCDGCQRSYKDWADLSGTVEVNSTQRYVYRCKKCDFNLHFLCGPLPTSVKYEFHIHRLSLVDHSSTEDDSDEYYCDVCEQERDSFFRVYYCKECKYVAHIHCLISEIVRETKALNCTEFRALGESRWEFGIEIEKEIQDDDNDDDDDDDDDVDDDDDDDEDDDDDDDDATKHLSMSDIIARLTVKEWNSLVDPFGCKDPKHNSHRIASHNRYAELNSRFDHKGISIDDIGRIQQFFSFGSDELVNFCNELQFFTPSEGLKIDDKYLRQNVEDVDGYMVPKTLVHILKTLLHKYGHLGGKSDLTPNMKSVASTLLCIAIDKMCRTMVEDITKDDLTNWYFYLDAIKKISGFEIIELGSFDSFLSPTFLGFEVTRHEKEIEEKLDLKIAKLEDELKRYKGNRKKLKEYASEKSDFIKECMSKASEWKRKFLGDKWF